MTSVYTFQAVRVTFPGGSYWTCWPISPKGVPDPPPGFTLNHTETGYLTSRMFKLQVWIDTSRVL